MVSLINNTAHRSIICAIVLMLMWQVAGGAQQDVAFHFGEGDQARLARADAVEIGGIRYVSLNQVIEQFGGYVDLAAGRAQIMLDGHGAIVTLNDVRVETGEQTFSLYHPLLRETDEALMALGDYERFFRNVFDTRLWVDQLSPTADPESDPDLDELLAQINLAPQPSARRQIRRIVLDPGHGGTDPGAVGPNGLEEKDVTLALAQALKRALDREFDGEIILTREEDVELPDRARSNFAVQSEGDLVISLHTGASYAPHARGFEIFYVDSPEGSDERPPYAARSRLLASSVARALSETGVTPNRGIRSAPIRVLAGVPLPAIYIEVGCISNPDEENLLATQAHREQLAAGIVQGILAYADGMDRASGGSP